MKRFLFTLAMLVVGLSPVWACVGARPLGMGGAFIGLADDADATYWNPAALAFQEKLQVKGMLVLSDQINYKSNFSLVSPLEGTGSAVGVNIIGYNEASAFVEGIQVSTQNSATKLCFGEKISENVAIGGALTRHTTHISLEGGGESMSGDTDAAIGIDLAAYGRIGGNWSWGVLVQDFNEPTEEIEGTELIKWVRNVRPGVAYRTFHGDDDILTFTADVYNLFGAADMNPALCLGAELNANNNAWALRGGMYQLGSESGVMMTLGGSARLNDMIVIDAAMVDGKGIIGGSLTF